jgi:hypothetical protein
MEKPIIVTFDLITINDSRCWIWWVLQILYVYMCESVNMSTVHTVRSFCINGRQSILDWM